MRDPKARIGDVVRLPIDSKKFGRIATQNAKNVILQKIREEERKSLFQDWYCKEKDIVSGVVQRYVNHNYYIDLGKIDAVLTENEQVKTEKFRPTERIRLYVLEVKDANRGPRISVSRTHPELVKRLFESEVAEVKDGTVEIRAIAREAGSRTKIAVSSNDPNVDPVGACVGINGARVNAVVQELRGEKIDIINWDDNPAFLIENALSPAKVILVAADEDAKEAEVIVPDHQLSPEVMPQLCLLQPVQKVPFRARVIPAAHIVIHLLDDPLLGHRLCGRRHPIGLLAQRTGRLQIILRIQCPVFLIHIFLCFLFSLSGSLCRLPVTLPGPLPRIPPPALHSR